MSDIRYLPLSQSDQALLLSLLEAEEKTWMSELSWDYSPIRRILASFINQRLLPGFVAVCDNRAFAYSYFSANRAKATIGAVYASGTSRSQQAVEEIISLTATSLKNSPGIDRIEAQIMPFNNVRHTEAFIRQNFSCYPRYYMELDIDRNCKPEPACSAAAISRWNSSNLFRAAEMTARSYWNQVDALICKDYRTGEGCEVYLRNLLESPGCGLYMPESSFMALDVHGCLRGYVISSRISEAAGIIPQIAVDPSCQSLGIGNALICRALEALKTSGLHTAGLTVTSANRRAFQWYQRLGFKIRKEFGAYVWQRQPSII